jgi:Domain of unknown function (DUF4398)
MHFGEHLPEGTLEDIQFMDKALSGSVKVAFALLAVTAGVAAYAANPIADEKIAVAKASLDRAEQSGAPQAAPVELATARDKLARAEKANADHKPKPAALLADQANIDAQVAEAMAMQARSRKAATEFDTSMQALRQESTRASQPSQ